MFAVLQFARKSLRKLTIPAMILGLAACDTVPGAGLSGGAPFGGDPVPVALLVPSGSGQGTDELIAHPIALPAVP